ncbi:hypothetical protein [Allorhodopirellula solitaria]|uniref:Polysaccharide biosynthesis protein n=1 Tax=Allorhodopirellula solitaria TaxID=2527987 RepID=A0A5C5WQQ3_9BACT|nr:hypothetical protein [Allorhodopirellula solitaria]TWT52122.1 hypothetical protein CA85_50900 [Allorhodopirellula solitaria]
MNQRAYVGAQRFRQGVASLATSKILALLLQVLAIPIAVRELGSQQYATYISLVAASLLPSVFLLRLGPAFAARVAMLWRGEDHSKLSAEVQSAVVLSLGNALLAALVSFAMLATVPLGWLLGPANEHAAGLLAAMSLLSILGGVLMVLESIQVGLHETRWLGVQAGLANGLAILMLVVYFPSRPSIWTLFIALQVIPFTCRLANAAAMVLIHLAIFSRWHVRIGSIQELSGPAFRYTIVAGLGSYMGLQLPILLVSSLGTETMSAAFAIAMQISMQFIRGFGVVLGPLVPAVSDMIAENRYASISTRYKQLLWACNVAGAIGVLSWLIASILFFESFDLSQFVLSGVFFSAGVFSWGMILESAMANWVYATGSASEINMVYRAMLARAFCASLIVLACLSTGFPEGCLLFMALSVFVISAVPLMRNTKYVFSNLSTTSATASKTIEC